MTKTHLKLHQKLGIYGILQTSRPTVREGWLWGWGVLATALHPLLWALLFSAWNPFLHRPLFTLRVARWLPAAPGKHLIFDKEGHIAPTKVLRLVLTWHIWALCSSLNESPLIKWVMGFKTTYCNKCVCRSILKCLVMYHWNVPLK